MSGKRVDKRIIRTRKLLQGALLELLDEKPFESLSVTEIADRAGVARPTFYLHYSSKEELMISFFEELMRGFYDAIEERPYPGDGSLVVPIFEVWAENRDLFRKLKRANLMTELFERARVAIHEMIRDRINPEPREDVSPQTTYYLPDYLAGSLFMILAHWIEEDMPYTPEEMKQVFMDLIGPGIDLLVSSES